VSRCVFYRLFHAFSSFNIDTTTKKARDPFLFSLHVFCCCVALRCVAGFLQVEKRPNSEGTAIVALVVEGSQAEAAGLKVGDILCFSGSDGQEEITYDMFLELAKAGQRPLRKYSTSLES
jgi:hypothetical protein